MYAKKNKPMYGNGGMAKLAQYMEGGVSDPVKGSNPSMSPLANQAAKYETPQYGDPRKIDRNLQELISILRRNSEQDPETVAVFNELMGKANSLRDSYPGGGYNKDWDDQHGQFYSDLFYAGLQNPESGIGRLVDGKVVEQRRRGVPSYKNGGKVVSYGKGGKMKYKKGGFPDLTGDGKVTMADILKGRGVGK